MKNLVAFCCDQNIQIIIMEGTMLPYTVYAPRRVNIWKIYGHIGICAQISPIYVHIYISLCKLGFI